MPTKQQIANIHLWSINCLVLGAVSLLFSAYINANDLNILPKEHGFEPDIAFIPAGTFQMGNLVGDDRWGNETPIHSVT